MVLFLLVLSTVTSTALTLDLKVPIVLSSTSAGFARNYDDLSMPEDGDDCDPNALRSSTVGRLTPPTRKALKHFSLVSTSAGIAAIYEDTSVPEHGGDCARALRSSTVGRLTPPTRKALKHFSLVSTSAGIAAIYEDTSVPEHGGDCGIRASSLSTEAGLASPTRKPNPSPASSTVGRLAPPTRKALKHFSLVSTAAGIAAISEDASVPEHGGDCGIRASSLSTEAGLASPTRKPNPSPASSTVGRLAPPTRKALKHFSLVSTAAGIAAISEDASVPEHGGDCGIRASSLTWATHRRIPQRAIRVGVHDLGS